MYLLMATSQNVDRIIRDFSNGQQQYAAAHLFFVDGTCPLSLLGARAPGGIDLPYRRLALRIAIANTSVRLSSVHRPP